MIGGCGCGEGVYGGGFDVIGGYFVKGAGFARGDGVLRVRRRVVVVCVD